MKRKDQQCIAKQLTQNVLTKYFMLTMKLVFPVMKMNCPNADTVDNAVINDDVCGNNVDVPRFRHDILEPLYHQTIFFFPFSPWSCYAVSTSGNNSHQQTINQANVSMEPVPTCQVALPAYIFSHIQCLSFCFA